MDTVESYVTSRLKEMLFVYFDTKDDSFAEMDSFMKTFVDTYEFALHVYNEKSYLEGVRDLVDHHGIRAIFLGTRRTDPHGGECFTCVYSLYRVPDVETSLSSPTPTRSYSRYLRPLLSWMAIIHASQLYH